MDKEEKEDIEEGEMSKEEMEEKEQETFQPSETDSFGADYTVDSLIKRLKNGDIFIPKFERNYIWDINKASRFIESLLLGLPVPGIFVSREDNRKLLVIDGHQRLKTLLYFYTGIFEPTNKKFALVNVNEKFVGLGYNDLTDAKMDDLRRRLDDAVIHVTVIPRNKKDTEQKTTYEIFERLNSGGVLLNPQEIRRAIYSGKFVELIDTLNLDKSWRDMVRKEVDTRYRDQENILRFFALYYDRNYKKPMKTFLSKYMADNRNLDREVTGDKFKALWEETIKTIHEDIGVDAFRRYGKFVAGIYDAVMIGVAARLQQGGISDIDGLKKAYAELVKSKAFNSFIDYHTTDEEKVSGRIKLAIDAFSKIG